MLVAMAGVRLWTAVLVALIAPCLGHSQVTDSSKPVAVLNRYCVTCQELISNRIAQGEMEEYEEVER